MVQPGSSRYFSDNLKRCDKMDFLAAIYCVCCEQHTTFQSADDTHQSVIVAVYFRFKTHCLTMGYNLSGKIFFA